MEQKESKTEKTNKKLNEKIGEDRTNIPLSSMDPYMSNNNISLVLKNKRS